MRNKYIAQKNKGKFLKKEAKGEGVQIIQFSPQNFCPQNLALKIFS